MCFLFGIFKGNFVFFVRFFLFIKKYYHITSPSSCSLDANNAANPFFVAITSESSFDG